MQRALRRRHARAGRAAAAGRMAVARALLTSTAMEQPTHRLAEPPVPPPAASRWWRRPRWRYAAAAFLLGVVESTVAVALGFRARLGDLDVTLATGALIELSFAVFGFLLGVTVEARRRERAAAAEVEAQLRALGRAQARLAQSEKLAALGELASAIAHEVRNPLAILRSLAQNAAEEPAGEAAEASCGQMIEEIDRLAHVTASLVDFARPVRLERMTVPAAELAERTLALAERLLEARAVRLQLAPAADAALAVDADPELLCQVLLGLLDNAAQASPAGGVVRLGWAPSDGGGVAFTVTDQGAGVPAALRARVFEPFFTTRPGGHGLGLAVARQIVEAHGGAIEVDDAPAAAAGSGPGGALFRVRLPARDWESAA